MQSVSVIGAAHQRQQKPCQDASLSASLTGDGGQLMLLVVADGHGAERHPFSHRGSALACRVARDAVETWLNCTLVAEAERWHHLLEEVLPITIQQRWLSAITVDWHSQPESTGERFSPLLYGTTLGLVILTQHWWGCTGLGDWDLAGVNGDGHAELLSEEIEYNKSEATGSLCQPPEQQDWLERTQLQHLEPPSELRALVLSTDGVRKSCTTDADYLQLCAELTELRHIQELKQGLSHVTAFGSGDDVSIAMALRT